MCSQYNKVKNPVLRGKYVLSIITTSLHLNVCSDTINVCGEVVDQRFILDVVEVGAHLSSLVYIVCFIVGFCVVYVFWNAHRSI